jgi:hypothetical protein
MVMTGLNQDNIDYVAHAIDDAIRKFDWFILLLTQFKHINLDHFSYSNLLDVSVYYSGRLKAKYFLIFQIVPILNVHKW